MSLLGYTTQNRAWWLTPTLVSVSWVFSSLEVQDLLVVRKSLTFFLTPAHLLNSCRSLLCLPGLEVSYSPGAAWRGCTTEPSQGSLSLPRLAAPWLAAKGAEPTLECTRCCTTAVTASSQVAFLKIIEGCKYSTNSRHWTIPCNLVCLASKARTKQQELDPPRTGL